jgi:hypothetical protein
MRQLGGDKVISEGVFDQIGVVPDAQFVHDPILVKGHGSSGHVENIADLFHRFSFGKQVQNFTLPLGQSFSLFYQFMVLPSQKVDPVFREARR